MTRRWRRLAVTGLYLFGRRLPAFAADRFPRPEFDSGYMYPPEQMPVPVTDVGAWVHLAVFIALMALAGWVALRQRSRRTMVWLCVLAAVYLGFFRHGCVCSVGSLQNVVAACVDATFAVRPVTVVLFLVPLIAALFFGRVFCGGVCPLGVLQDLVVLRPRAVPRWLDLVLGHLRYVVLFVTLLFVITGTGFFLCRLDPFVPFFRVEASFPLLVPGVILLLLGIVIGRPYCRYLCAYGLLLEWASRLSRRHLRITPEECAMSALRARLSVWLHPHAGGRG